MPYISVLLHCKTSSQLFEHCIADNIITHHCHIHHYLTFFIRIDCSCDDGFYSFGVHLCLDQVRLPCMLVRFQSEYCLQFSIIDGQLLKLLIQLELGSDRLNVSLCPE